MADHWLKECPIHGVIHPEQGVRMGEQIFPAGWIPVAGSNSGRLKRLPYRTGRAFRLYSLGSSYA